MSSSKLAVKYPNASHPAAPTVDNLISLGFPPEEVKNYYIYDMGLTKNDTMLNIQSLLNRCKKGKQIFKMSVPSKGVKKETMRWLMDQTREYSLMPEMLKKLKRGDWFSLGEMGFAISRNLDIVRLW